MLLRKKQRVFSRTRLINCSPKHQFSTNNARSQICSSVLTKFENCPTRQLPSPANPLNPHLSTPRLTTTGTAERACVHAPLPRCCYKELNPSLAKAEHHGNRLRDAFASSRAVVRVRMADAARALLGAANRNRPLSNSVQYASI